jgi:hypothetical protein
MKRSTEKIVILLGCMFLLGFMWFDLSNKVESGKPFQLNDKWYQAKEVPKP